MTRASAGNFGQSSRIVLEGCNDTRQYKFREFRFLTLPGGVNTRAFQLSAAQSAPECKAISEIISAGSRNLQQESLHLPSQIPKRDDGWLHEIKDARDFPVRIFGALKNVRHSRSPSIK